MDAEPEKIPTKIMEAAPEKIQQPLAQMWPQHEKSPIDLTLDACGANSGEP